MRPLTGAEQRRVKENMGLVGQVIAEASASGVTAKGFQAIRLLAQGYNSREIGKRFGVQANHVTAWVAKARKKLTLLA